MLGGLITEIGKRRGWKGEDRTSMQWFTDHNNTVKLYALGTWKSFDLFKDHCVCCKKTKNKGESQ